jgi:hypothetical protein
MACADAAMAKVKAATAINLIICFLLHEIFETSASLGLFRQDLGHWLPIMESKAWLA